MKNSITKFAAITILFTVACAQSWADERQSQGRSIDIGQLEERMRVDFETHDADSDGVISLEEFTTMNRNRVSGGGREFNRDSRLKEVSRPTESLRKQRKSDKFDERRRERAAEQIRRRAEHDSKEFNTVDQNEDGLVDEEEFSQPRSAMFQEQVNRDHQQFDADGNGGLDLTEFFGPRIEQLREMDTDGDNMVSPDEMRQFRDQQMQKRDLERSSESN